MSEGKGKEGVLTATRLLIPTPSQTSPRADHHDEPTTMLRMYYANYQRLKKEQSTLNNQLAIIEREREELRERLEAMKVSVHSCSENRKKSANAIAGQPMKSTAISCAPSQSASASMVPRGHCCSTSRSSTAHSTTQKSMRQYCCQSTKRTRKDSSPILSKALSPNHDTTTMHSSHMHTCRAHFYHTTTSP